MLSQLETKRLLLRKIAVSDAEAMYRMEIDPEVHKYVGRKPVTDMSQILEAIAFINEQYVCNGVGRMAVVDKQTNEFVGWCGLKLFRETINGHSNFYDLGYRFVRAHWGKGYATESAAAVCDHAFNLATNELFAMTDVGNTASKNVLEKIGFRYIETFNYDATITASWRTGAEPTNWYRLERKDYELL